MEQRYSLSTGGTPPVYNESTRYNTTTTTDEVNKELTTARVEFNTTDMQRFMKDRSIKVLWERAYFCPCMNKDTGHPRMECPRCHGKGIAYLPAVETLMAIQSQEKGTGNYDIGLIDTGTAIGTTLLETRVSYRDRFTVPEVIMPQSLIYYVDETRIKKGIPLYYDVKEVTFITTQEGIISEEDYKVENNRLFLDSKYTGYTVSLNIFMTLRYVVSDILKESRYQYTKFNQPKTKFENLPQKLLLKREDVIVVPEPYKVSGGIQEDIELQIDDPKASRNTSTNIGGFFGGMLG